MTTVTIRRARSIELTEIPSTSWNGSTSPAKHDLTTLLLADFSPHGLDHLRADISRLTDRLHTSPLST
jgi:hypothetical protein